MVAYEVVNLTPLIMGLPFTAINWPIFDEDLQEKLTFNYNLMKDQSK